MYDIEKFYQAKDVADAIQALQKDPDAVVISGGSDVLIKIREGKMAGCSLVSIHGLKELEGVSLREDDTIAIGSATTFSHITNDPIIQERIPVLGYAVDQVGGPQLRNMGTIGGNVCNGVTSADSASTLFVLNAVLHLVGPNGERLVPIREFYTGPGRTVRQHEEILTEILIRKEDYQGYGGHYIKYGKREAMEIATMGCAVLVKLGGTNDTVEDLRIAFGVAAPTPIRCPKTEEKVKGMAVGPKLLETAAKGVLDEVNPRTSWRASREFRLQLIEEMTRRALTEAVTHAGGEIHA